ncbi:MAG: hypothetical protein EOP49_34390, partial [Sphingobacteriales bacterium]
MADLLFPALLAIIVALTAYKNQFTVLEEVKDGMIGIASYEGVDIGARVRKFYLTGFVLVTGFLLLLPLYRYIICRLGVSRQHQTYLATLSLLGMIVNFATGILYAQWHWVGQVFVMFPAVFFLESVVTHSTRKRLLLDWDRICYALVLSFIVSLAASDITGYYGTAWSGSAHLPVITGVFALLLWVFGRIAPDKFTRVAYAIAALGLWPVLLFLTNEVI